MAVERWAEGQVLAFNIINAAERSNSITNILVQGRDPRPLLDYCRDKCGVILGVGLGALEGKAFRIAHMGHGDAPMVLGTLGAVEMGLKALGIPHGAGSIRSGRILRARSTGLRRRHLYKHASHRTGKAATPAALPITVLAPQPGW